MAQQKLQSINQTLSIIRGRSTTDDINHNNNLAYAPMNNVLNGSKTHSNDNKLKQPNLNVSSISLENNNVIPERRNSAVSTGSASQYLATNAAMKSSRPRCDSYNGQPTTIQNYPASTSGSSDKVLHSPTYSYQQQVQIPHLHYKSHADKIAYVTNAVSNAAPANNLNTSNCSANVMASPKYGRLKPLTVDTGINESYYYPPSGSANHQHRSHFQQHYAQQQQQPHQHHQHRHSPYTTIRTTHLTPTKVKHSVSSPSSHHHAAATKTLASNDDDDIAGQYATLLTLSDQPKPSSVHPENELLESETHYTEILCRKPSAPLPLTERNHFQTKEANVVSKSQGLGGCWTTNEKNERVWLSMDNR